MCVFACFYSDHESYESDRSEGSVELSRATKAYKSR